MTINWPNNSRKKRAVIKGGQSQGELSGRALQGSAKGLVLFNIFITNLKGEGRLHKNEIRRWLLRAQGRRTPHRRGRTCRTRRSTFLKAVRPPYVVQCLRGLLVVGQQLIGRVLSHSAAPFRKELLPGAPATRTAHAAPAGGQSASPPRRLTSSSAAPPSFLLSVSPFLSPSSFTLPFFSPPSLCFLPASPPSLQPFRLPGFTGRPCPLNPKLAKRVQYPGLDGSSCRIKRQRQQKCLRWCSRDREEDLSTRPARKFKT